MTRRAAGIYITMWQIRSILEKTKTSAIPESKQKLQSFRLARGKPWTNKGVLGDPYQIQQYYNSNRALQHYYVLYEERMRVLLYYGASADARGTKVRDVHNTTIQQHCS